MAAGASKSALHLPDSVRHPLAIKTHASSLDHSDTTTLIHLSYVCPCIFPFIPLAIAFLSRTHVRLRPSSFSFFLFFFFSDIVMLGRLGDQCVIDLFLVVVLITPRSSRLCTYYHHLVSPFRAGPGDVAVVRFRRWCYPARHSDALWGVSHSSCLSTAILDTDNLVSYFTITNGRVVRCTFESGLNLSRPST